MYSFWLLVLLLSLMNLVSGRPQQTDEMILTSFSTNDTEAKDDKGFEAFYPREVYGVPNGSSRPAHGHGSFYQFRNPALVDAKNSPAYGYRFDGGRRFNFD